ncbi:hypothetical protein ZIOFF_014870 [Zingiber officinale]|uniref:Squalene synthase n=1 Tax=Zingiber officinale TaxID=94328 RepID=A0A8J5LPU9_ZINOF|nr:hypothetical protein ZIOFF_014870 [Zingiber officinale]
MHFYSGLAEDDTSIPSDIKVPILQSFYCHIYDSQWHFSCGTKEYKVLMDKFHLVSTAFLELDRRSASSSIPFFEDAIYLNNDSHSLLMFQLYFILLLNKPCFDVSSYIAFMASSYQEAIEDITKRMGAGMAKFICKEVETVDDYDEYCHYVAGLVGLGLSKLFHASGSEDLASDNLSNSMGLFLQKTNIIRDYLEDINEIPKSRMFWPREIWSKYADKLEDFKYAENSTKAVQCLNDLVTNALMHIEDCLHYMSSLKDLSIFQFCAIPQIMAIGTLALCYNNMQVFRGVVKMRRGSFTSIGSVYLSQIFLSSQNAGEKENSSGFLVENPFSQIFPYTCLYHGVRQQFMVFVIESQGLTARVIAQTETMADVYGVFFDFSSLLESKINDDDPNASLTRKRVQAVKDRCISSGLLNKRKFHVHNRKSYTSLLIMVIVLVVAMLFSLPRRKVLVD